MLMETPGVTSDIEPGVSIYTGMTWKSLLQGSRTASSETTGGTYIVENIATGQWRCRFGFPTMPGRPYSVVGQYSDRQIALTAAERHDFRFWTSTMERAGIRPIFMGSPGEVSEFVADLPEFEREDATDLLLGEKLLPDGRPFASSASYFHAAKISLKQEKAGTLSMTLAVDPREMPTWMMQSCLGSRLILGAVLESSDLETDWLERGQSAIRRSFALSRDNHFHGWIRTRYDRWGLVASAMTRTSDSVEEAVAETLRRLIGCPTRRELATNRDAIDKLEKLDREFYLDMSRGFSAA